MTPPPAVALLLAGGTGSRMGRPKQFIELRGRPALRYALRAFEEAPSVEKVYAVGDRARIEKLVREAGVGKYAGCGAPGEARALSTRSGLAVLCAEPDEAIVLVHDGSRCLVTPELVERVVAAARKGADGVIPALPVSDTIKVTDGGSVIRTLDRAPLHAAQTPQAFRLGRLREVYAAPEEVLRSATDDASLVEAAGGRVVLVAGEKTNIKLTTPEDLILAEAILRVRGAGRPGEPTPGRGASASPVSARREGAAS